MVFNTCSNVYLNVLFHVCCNTLFNKSSHTHVHSCVYVVVNDGGDTDSEITACRAYFCEWDDRSKEEQINAWKQLGLPEPLQIDTGGKSIHNYWILKKTIDPKTWKPIQERLLDYADADRALKNQIKTLKSFFSLKSIDEINSIQELEYLINQSDVCKLKKNAKHTVFSDGN